MTATPLGDLLAARPDLIAAITAARRREHERPLRVDTAAAALGHGVLDVLDAIDQAHVLNGAPHALTVLRDACCRLAATASETLAVVVEARVGRRPHIAAEKLPAFLAREENLLVDSFLHADATALEAHAWILRDRAKRVLHSLRQLSEGTDAAYFSQTRERDVIEVIAVAIALPVVIDAPRLAAA
jgi:hypothetical protein